MAYFGFQWLNSGHYGFNRGKIVRIMADLSTFYTEMAYFMADLGQSRISTPYININ